MKKDEICANNWIERSNVLNEMRTPLNLTEMRLLLVYQSKINARDIDTIRVTFTLESFQKIMDIKNVDISALKRNMKKISQRSVELPYKNGFQFVPLYQRCGLYQNSEGEWCIDLECNQEILPYMFEMKKNYFKYQLWNSIKLTSLNQIRMYEILKQYEKIGKRKVFIEELKLMLGISIEQYSQYRDFKRYVLDVCQKALEENTDIKYTYETIKGAKGKVLSIVFTITKNKNFKDDLRLKEFIKPEDLEDIKDVSVETVENTVKSPVNTTLESLYYRCGKAYTLEQLEMISDYINNSGVKLNVSTENYIYSVYANIKIKGNKVNNPFRYTFSVIEKQINDYIFAPNKQKEEEKSQERKSSYNIEDFKDLIHTTERWMGEESSKEDDFDEIINSGVIPFD